MSQLKKGFESNAIGFAQRRTVALVQFSLVCLLFSAGSAQADIYFNPRFLSDDPATVADLSIFENGQEIPPGIYRVDIYLNKGFITTRDVTFEADEKSHELQPCLTRGQLDGMGVNTAAVSGMNAIASQACVPISSLIKEASAHFDVGQQRLNLSIPQAFMGNRARGYIPPENWDNGINAALLNYNLTANQSHNSLSGNSQYTYLNLQSGLNLGPWRIRDNSSWSYNAGGNSTTRKKNIWQHINSWLERDIAALRARLTMGDAFTNGDVFDSINFRGVQIASLESMLPDSQRGFAPVLHGIARGTALVSVKQNGYEIYQSTVPPGPFTIDDLYAATSGGDLQMTIKESDGSSQVINIPWSTVPVLQREGQNRYALSFGEYRSGNNTQQRPGFFQWTLMRGFPAGLTAYGGGQMSNRYRALNLGMGMNMGTLGAVSLDVTQANAVLPDDSHHQGQSLHFLYNKSFNSIGTNLQLAGYRYSTRGYYSFSDTTYRHQSGYTDQQQDGTRPKYFDSYNLNYNKRGRLEASISQQLKWASLYLRAYQQTYWSTDKSDQQVMLGLYTSMGDINWNLSFSHAKNAWQQGYDRMLALSVNIPLSHWLSHSRQSVWRNSSATYSMSNDLKSRMNNQVGLNGTLLKENNLSYSVQTGYARGDNEGSSTSGYTALDYRGGYGNANIGYSHNQNVDQTYFGLSGGVLAHADGVTFSQPLNDTVVLVKAPGTHGVKVENQIGVHTDWRGYAVLPYATEYRENRIALDTNSLADNVDLDEAVVSVVPTHGAVVRAKFKTRVGVKMLMTLLHNGKPVPFGAIASVGDHQNSSIVADNGQVYLSGMPLSGKVSVEWGKAKDASCVASYKLPDENRKQVLSQITLNCD